MAKRDTDALTKTGNAPPPGVEHPRRKVAFFITPDQLHALSALETANSNVQGFTPPTWLALARKALVTLSPELSLTPAGRAFLAFNRTLDAVNRLSATGQPDEPRILVKEAP